ncbi:hypothetical protein ACFL1R_01245 [Candidatus Latescibacterota bacterium]
MGRSIRMFSVLVMILLLSSVVQAQTLLIDQKNVLKDLKGVEVLVEDLKPDIEKDGLSKSSIQTDVELKLRMAGIKVLTEEEWLKEPGTPYLYVSVNSFKKEEEVSYSINIALELNETVCLVRDLTMSCNAVTWSTSYIGKVGKLKVNEIRDGVKDRVDIFINDYLAVNPKE